MAFSSTKGEGLESDSQASWVIDAEAETVKGQLKKVLEEPLEKVSGRLEDSWVKHTSIEMRMMYSEEQLHEAVRQIKNAFDVYSHTQSGAIYYIRIL